MNNVRLHKMIDFNRFNKLFSHLTWNKKYLIGFLFMCLWTIGTYSEASDVPGAPRKIVILAGKKSHGPKVHEYIKSARLLKTMLDQASNVKNIQTEIHYNGWPEDPSTLEDADLILTISDGRDAVKGTVPFMTPERMKVMQRQMDRGCGYAVIHYSTFATDNYADQILDWGGGYFDWQEEGIEQAPLEQWYSAYTVKDTLVEVATPGDEILKGIPGTFRLKEEFYYNIRFKENDERFTPLLNVPALDGKQKFGGIVAWAVEREDGGRGFGTTMGHFYSNWKDNNFRKFILNALVWAAGAKVPKGGVEASFYTDDQVTRHLYGKSIKALLLTGNNHPAHLWKETTPVIKKALEMDSRVHVDISEDINDLAWYDLEDYDFLVMNYCNWEDSIGLVPSGKQAFAKYLSGGGGLVLIHFANGAFHYSLPGAGASDWPDYRKICRRVWDHDAGSGHDKYGKFTVVPTEADHPITQGMSTFETVDELYFGQAGDLPIIPLITAKSTVTGKDEPLAWAYDYDQGKVFQTVLGHSAESLSVPEVMTLIIRGAMWTIGEKVQINP